MGLMGSFGKAAGYGFTGNRDPARDLTDALGVFGQKSSAPVVTPQKSILSSLCPNTAFKVDATNFQNAIQTGNKGGLHSVKSDVGGMKLQISNVIRAAQGEVAAAAKASGYNDIKQLYPDLRMAAGGEAGMVLNMAADAISTSITGQGTLITAEMKPSTLGDVEDAITDVKSGKIDAKAADSKIASALVSASSPSNPETTSINMPSFGKTPAMHTSGFNWKDFFDQGHQIADLMAIDPDNPQAHLVPEIVALNTMESNIDEGLNHIKWEEEQRPKVDADWLNTEVALMTFPEGRLDTMFGLYHYPQDRVPYQEVLKAMQGSPATPPPERQMAVAAPLMNAPRPPMAEDEDTGRWA